MKKAGGANRPDLGWGVGTEKGTVSESREAGGARLGEGWAGGGEVRGVPQRLGDSQTQGVEEEEQGSWWKMLGSSGA